MKYQIVFETEHGVVCKKYDDPKILSRYAAKQTANRHANELRKNYQSVQVLSVNLLKETT